MDVLLRRLASVAFRRGMAGERWTWFVVALAAFLLRRARRPAKATILTVPIEPGERYLVSLYGPEGPGADGSSGI